MGSDTPWWVARMLLARRRKKRRAAARRKQREKEADKASRIDLEAAAHAAQGVLEGFGEVKEGLQTLKRAILPGDDRKSDSETDKPESPADPADQEPESHDVE